MKQSILHFSLLAALLMSLGVASTGCNNDTDPPDLPPPVVNDGELITTLNLQFVDVADTSVHPTFTFSDPDGEGGNAPTQWDTIRLASGRTYNLSLEILDESDAANVEDITAEILAEAAEHLFCFTVSGVTITIARTDTDGTYEVGLQSTWSPTGAAGTGSTTVTLKHQPEVKDGSCAPGETDIEVAFVTQII
jgi:hypothetical protein